MNTNTAPPAGSQEWHESRGLSRVDDGQGATALDSQSSDEYHATEAPRPHASSAKRKPVPKPAPSSRELEGADDGATPHASTDGDR